MAFFDNLLNSLKRVFSGEPARRPQSPAEPIRPATIGPGSSATLSPPAPIGPPRLQPEPVRLTELEGNPFAPLTDADVKKQAQGLGSLWNTPWFGRRDLIPPARDPRTLLIDRAMTSHGLLTAEELGEIHTIGAQMDAIRPDLAAAHEMARAAVKRSQEEYEALKRQKKAEAAERRRMHAEAVAMRRATDIVFLGRSVSRRLADRAAHVERLERLGLPVLAEPSDVADALGISIPRLRWLAFHNEAATRIHYVRFTVPKKSGGVRELSAPHRSLAAAQQWILDNILARVPVHDAAHGFVAGRSTVTNATPHAGKQVVVNADLKDFFPSITFPRVRGVFENLGYSPAAATILALLATEAPRRTMVYGGQTYEVATGPRALPQGACTSPALSNLVARRMDSRLSGIAAKLGWNYTRYADDLTFSADGEAGEKVGYLLARIRHIAQDEGFAVNESKTRVQRPNTAQTVTGLVVNRRVAVPRTTVRRLRAILHRARREGLAAQNREGREHFDAWLGGMIAYVSMANAGQGEKLRLAWESVNREQPG